jgi:hypothetical protein
MSDTKASKTQKQAPSQVYFLPDAGVSVEATSVDEAVAKANKLTTKVEDGDA